jgi:predicted nucleotidyltransferase
VPRVARVVAFSTTPEMAEEIDRLAAEQSCTRSELLRAAVRAYQAATLHVPLYAAETTSLYRPAPPSAASLPGLARVLASRPRIAAACAAAGVARLWVFGSAVRSDFDATHSDFDFLVEFEPDAERKPWFGETTDLRDELSRLLEGPVDLGEMAALLNPYVRATVDAEKVLVYEHA